MDNGKVVATTTLLHCFLRIVGLDSCLAPPLVLGSSCFAPSCWLGLGLGRDLCDVVMCVRDLGIFWGGVPPGDRREREGGKQEAQRVGGWLGSVHVDWWVARGAKGCWGA